MSRWLNKVGDFLEKLDDKAEKVVDEKLLLAKGQDDEEDASFENMRVATILAARGLNDTEEDDGKPVAAVTDEQENVFEGFNEELTVTDETTKVPMYLDETLTESAEQKNTAAEVTDDPTALKGEDFAIASEPSTDEITETPPEKEADTAEETETNSTQVDPTTEGTQADAALVETPPSTAGSIKAPVVAPKSLMPPPRPPVNRTASPTPQLRQAQKESRTLRRQVLQLHSQLERAEAEIQAQRDELDRAAERIEKDRARHKTDREAATARHQAEMEVLKDSHDKTLREAKSRADALLEETRQQLRDLEQRHVQEGGDWNKELGSAVEREQEMMQRFALLEDEKATLLSHISTLQAQQEALGSRLESLSETADNAMAREREAEDRLDEALSLHARQMSQRNARETQLEQTVAELGAALVSARGKAKTGISSGANQFPGDATSQHEQSSRQQAVLQQEAEGLRGQLLHEKQRNDRLQQELREVNRERTDEVSVITARQLEYDRKVSEMSREMSELRRELRESKETSNSDSGDLTDDSRKQLKNLSEEVLRQRECVVNYKSEVSALKSRLKVALHRAEQAEASADHARSAATSRDLERGTKGSRRRRGGNVPSFQGSMKAALNLDASQAESSQWLGSCLDVVDESLSKIGSLLRHNPIARFVFGKCSFSKAYCLSQMQLTIQPIFI